MDCKVKLDFNKLVEDFKKKRITDMDVTVCFVDGKMIFPMQGDVENIALDLDQDNDTIYHEPIHVGNGIVLVHCDDGWELKSI